MARVRISGAEADELAAAIERTPFSDDLKERLWAELVGSPASFPTGPDGVFDIADVAAPDASQGIERGDWIVRLGLGRRGKILAAAFRALGPDIVASGREFNHRSQPALPAT
jgi:hypothetical protein